MKEKRIKISDFTLDPGPRYIRQDKIGEITSGEAFYINNLNKEFKKCFEDNCLLILDLDGVSGYPSSFLDEAIGELVYDFSLQEVRRLLKFETIMFKKRVGQVINETYEQWEKRRKEGKGIDHSPNIDKEIFFLNDAGKIDVKRIP